MCLSGDRRKVLSSYSSLQLREYRSWSSLHGVATRCPSEMNNDPVNIFVRAYYCADAYRMSIRCQHFRMSVMKVGIRWTSDKHFVGCPADVFGCLASIRWASARHPPGIRWASNWHPPGIRQASNWHPPGIRLADA